MRVWALLVCVGAAACATPAPPRAARRPPAPPPPPHYPPTLAHEIIEAQAQTYSGVTPAFDPLEADLRSGNDRLVVAALEVVEAIGAELAETARKCPQQQTFRCSFDQGLDTLVVDIDNLLVWLRRYGACAAMVPLERAAKQFDRIPRRVPPQALPDQRLIGDSPPDDSLPVRVFFCGMLAVKPKVAACFAPDRVPASVTVNVLIDGSGTVTSAVATGPFANTPAGTCVESAARSATFPPSKGFTKPSPFPFVLQSTASKSVSP